MFDIYEPALRALLEKAHDAGWQDCNARVAKDEKRETDIPWVVRRRMSVDALLAELSPDGVYDATKALRAAPHDAGGAKRVITPEQLAKLSAKIDSPEARAERAAFDAALDDDAGAPTPLAALEAVRERCAKVCDGIAKRREAMAWDGMAARTCAAAIRAMEV